MMNAIRLWIYRNARPLELALWKYHFEGGSKAAVLEALAAYQNPDGGFGHALEADNWNPASTPCTTAQGLKILREVDAEDMAQPMVQGVLRYLESGSGQWAKGWLFAVPGNESYPCAPWWDYSEERNGKEFVGITAELSAFVLRHGRPGSEVYTRAKGWAEGLLEQMLAAEAFGDMGLEGLMTLTDTMTALGMIAADDRRYADALRQHVCRAIENGAGKWHKYGVRPSNYIRSAESPFYQDSAALVAQEVQYLRETLPEGDVWDITWQWYGKMDRFSGEFAVSRTWWKASRAIENLRFLQAFGAID